MPPWCLPLLRRRIGGVSFPAFERTDRFVSWVCRIWLLVLLLGAFAGTVWINRNPEETAAIFDCLKLVEEAPTPRGRLVAMSVVLGPAAVAVVPPMFLVWITHSRRRLRRFNGRCLSCGEPRVSEFLGECSQCGSDYYSQDRYRHLIQTFKPQRRYSGLLKSLPTQLSALRTLIVPCLVSSGMFFASLPFLSAQGAAARAAAATSATCLAGVLCSLFVMLVVATCMMLKIRFNEERREVMNRVRLRGKCLECETPIEGTEFTCRSCNRSLLWQQPMPGSCRTYAVCEEPLEELRNDRRKSSCGFAASALLLMLAGAFKAAVQTEWALLWFDATATLLVLAAALATVVSLIRAWKLSNRTAAIQLHRYAGRCLTCGVERVSASTYCPVCGSDYARQDRLTSSFAPLIGDTAG